VLFRSPRAGSSARGFLPSTGKLVALEFPDGVRVDTGVEAGAEVTPFYDPMIAKLIAHAETRDGALDALAGALERTVVAGPRSNIGLLAALCRTRDFRAAKFDTGFIDRHLAALTAGNKGLDRGAVAFGAARLIERERERIATNGSGGSPGSPWDASDGFQLGGARTVSLALSAEGEPVVAQVRYGPQGMTVSVEGEKAAADSIAIDAGEAVFVLRHSRQTKVSRRDLAAAGAEGGTGGLLRAPMHGKVLALLVDEGAAVVRGQRLAIIEAMKMEHTLTAPVDGTVTSIVATANSQVAEGAAIMTIEESKGS